VRGGWKPRGKTGVPSDNVDDDECGQGKANKAGGGGFAAIHRYLCRSALLYFIVCRAQDIIRCTTLDEKVSPSEV
jgi:hypothetical protein